MAYVFHRNKAITLALPPIMVIDTAHIHFSKDPKVFLNLCPLSRWIKGHYMAIKGFIPSTISMGFDSSKDVASSLKIKSNFLICAPSTGGRKVTI
jgi:hypothetical protein